MFVDTYFLFPESLDFLHEVRGVPRRAGFKEREAQVDDGDALGGGGGL